jgi:hypothetical protein
MIPSKELTAEQLLQIKILILIGLTAWLSLCVYLIMNWSSLPRYISWPLAALEALIVMDIDTIKVLIESREQYNARMRARKEMR